MLKVVTLLSTLRDPTQIRRRRCATRQNPKEFGCFFSFKITYAPSSQKSTIWHFWKKKKTLVAHQKEGVDRTKKVQLEPKNGPLGTRGFGTYFYAVDHPPYVILKEKNNQTLIAHQKEGVDRTKKVQLEPKNGPLGTRGFGTYFWTVDHPPYVILKEKISW